MFCWTSGGLSCPEEYVCKHRCIIVEETLIYLLYYCLNVSTGWCVSFTGYAYPAGYIFLSGQ